VSVAVAHQHDAREGVRLARGRAARRVQRSPDVGEDHAVALAGLEHGEPQGAVLYLHFPDRAALLLAVVEYVDAREGLAAEIAAVEAAEDGPAQVRAWAAMQARRNPSIASLARALDQSRHGDDPAAVAWRDRTANRMRGATAIVKRLRGEGRLDSSWTTAEASTLAWELLSFRVWDDLVNEAGLTPERYAEIVTTAVLAALAAPIRRSRGRTAAG
jgi:AcrR family transcriptional regulator